MDDKTKATLKRFAKALLFSGVAFAAAAVLKAGPDAAAKDVLTIAANAFLTGALMAAEKWLTWAEPQLTDTNP